MTSTRMKIINAFFLVLVATAGLMAGLALLDATMDPNGDGWAPPPEPAPYVVHERPVTSVEMVVGLAGLLVEAEARADRMEKERDDLMEGAREIIRALITEIERLGGQHPTPAIRPPDVDLEA